MLLNYNLLSAFAWLTWNHLAAWTVVVVDNSHFFVLDYSSGCCFSCPCSAHLRSKAASRWLFSNINNVTSKCFSFNITCGILVHHQFTPFPPLMVRSELMTVSPSTPPSWSTSLGRRERLNLHLMISTGTGTYYCSSAWLYRCGHSKQEELVHVSCLPLHLFLDLWITSRQRCWKLSF